MHAPGAVHTDEEACDTADKLVVIATIACHEIARACPNQATGKGAHEEHTLDQIVVDDKIKAWHSMQG